MKHGQDALFPYLLLLNKVKEAANLSGFLLKHNWNFQSSCSNLDRLLTFSHTSTFQVVSLKQHGLNCAGPLIYRFFPIVNTTVLHHPWLNLWIPNWIQELHMQRPDCSKGQHPWPLQCLRVNHIVQQKENTAKWWCYCFYFEHRWEKMLNTRVEIQFQRKTFQCIVVLCGVEDSDNAAHNILT